MLLNHSFCFVFNSSEADALAMEEMDELDAYMNSIKSGVMDTKTRLRLKGELLHLKMEEKRLLRLVNIARPAMLPPLQPRYYICAVIPQGYLLNYLLQNNTKFSCFFTLIYQ